MRSARSIALVVFAVTGCGDASSPGRAASATASAGTPPTPPNPGSTAIAIATGTGSRHLHITTDAYDFEYSYPQAAGAIPALRAFLDKDIEIRRASLAAGGQQDAVDAKKDGRPFRPSSVLLDWQVVTDIPRWLSLSTIVESDTGGAHPNHSDGTLLWDRQANRRRLPMDLFTTAAALTAAIRTDFCRALDRQRAEKRQAPVNRNSGDDFDSCIDPAKEVVILGSSNRRAFDRIGILVPPYDAGPYVEGDYEVTLPVTPGVLAAVRPEYRDSFALGHAGPLPPKLSQ